MASKKYKKQPETCKQEGNWQKIHGSKEREIVLKTKKSEEKEKRQVFKEEIN